MKKVVCDTGALISLEKLPEGYSFIQKLYDKIIIPPKVLEEIVFPFQSIQEYLKKYNIVHFIEIHDNFPIMNDFFKILDAGEIEAISLAKAFNLELLIEERDGRVIAQQNGIKISGIAGQIMKAFDQKLINNEEALIMLRELYDKHRLNLRTYKELKEKIYE